MIWHLFRAQTKGVQEHGQAKKARKLTFGGFFTGEGALTKKGTRRGSHTRDGQQVKDGQGHRGPVDSKKAR